MTSLIIIITNTAVPSVGAKPVSVLHDDVINRDDVINNNNNNNNNNDKYGCTFCRCKNCECST